MNALSILAEFSTMGSVIVIALAGLGCIMVIIVAVAKIMVVGNPSELLVVSGKKSDGKGYRTLIGGRTLVIPIIEKVSKISLRNMQVGLEVKAQAGGGTMIPITLTGVANVKVSSDPSTRGNAIERFLDQPLIEMQRVARETLEGGIRAVIGKITPEEIVEDRDKFVATVMNEVTDDFCKLGLVIDSVNIQGVHDDEEYLESIARKASAEVRSDARKYEAAQKADADIKEAEAVALSRQAQAQREAEARTAESLGRRKAEEARISADKAIAEADNDLRIRKAELAREASLKEAERNKAAAQSEQSRLLATDVTQANAARDVAKAKAEGDAASIMEEGRARATAIEQIGKAIQQHPDALKVMLVEMTPSIVQELTKTIANVNLGDITVFDGGDGSAMSGAAMGRAKMLSESLATLESILGIDLRNLTQSIAGNITGTVDSPKQAPPILKESKPSPKRH